MSQNTNSSPFLISDHLSASPSPLIRPSPSSPHVLVIGGGVTGLTTAWFLLDSGYRVTIISQEWATHTSSHRLTSQVAGALWELPPAGCGPQAVQAKLDMVQGWALESFQVYSTMASNKELADAFGLKISSCTSFHTNKIEDDTVKSKKMDLILRNNLPGFQWSLPNLISKYNVNQSSHGGLKDAYEHLAPVIDTDIAMPFLLRHVRAKGATLITDTITTSLPAIESHLLRTYNASAIVNATGVGGLETASDESVYPLRGAVLRAINDGSDFPRVTNAMVVSTESQPDGNFRDMAFIVPRNDNILILGSITQPNQWNFNLTPESADIKEMRKRCEDLIPALKNARLDPKYPLAQGARPYRKGNVRVEREQPKGGGQSRIVHAYGHGGAGWSLAFGSGRECLRLIEEIHAEMEGGFEVSARL